MNVSSTDSLYEYPKWDELIHYQDWEKIIFEKAGHIVWFIHYLEDDCYIDFCWNINGVVNKQINLHNHELLDILADTPRRRIPWLWTDMLRIFFNEYSTKWEIITLWLKNPRILEILESLFEEWDISDLYDNSNWKDIISIEV